MLVNIDSFYQYNPTTYEFQCTNYWGTFAFKWFSRNYIVDFMSIDSIYFVGGVT